MEERQFRIKTLMFVVIVAAILCYVYRFYGMAILTFIVSMTIAFFHGNVQARRNRMRAKNEALRKLVLIQRDQDQADDERFARFGRSE